MTDQKQIVEEIAERVTTETKTIEVNGQTYRITTKFRDFVEAFNNPQSDTYGNGVRSVIKAYGLDPVTQYDSARVIVAENLAKLSDIVRDYAERKGITLQQYWNVAFKNAYNFERPDQKEWWKIVGKHTGFSSETVAPSIQVNIQNNTQNNTQVNMNQEEQVDWNAKFKEFLEKQ